MERKMKISKKILSVLLIGGLLLASMGCTDTTEKTTVTEERTVAETTKAEEDKETVAETTEATEAAEEDKPTGTKDPTKLVMGTNAAFPPFEMVEGTEIVGIDPEVMALIAEEMGLELEIKDMEFESLPMALRNGEIDIIGAGMTIKPDREETMSFSTPYYDASQTIIVLKDAGYASLEDITDKAIGVQTGTTGHDVAETVTASGSIKAFASGMLAVEALKNGEVEAVIIDNNPANVYFEQNADRFVLIESAFDNEAYAYAVQKGNADLLDQVEAALATIKEDGRFAQVVSKYIS